MRARGRWRGRGRGGGKGRGRMRGQGTRGTRRGRTARSIQANPVDDKWKWLSTYANDSSILSPVFNVESGPSAEAKCCDCPGDFFRLLFTVSWWTPSSKIRRCMLHFAYYHEKRGRYVVCAYKRQTTNSKKRKDIKTKNYCPKCDVHVCHGQCFEKYHTLVKF